MRKAMALLIVLMLVTVLIPMAGADTPSGKIIMYSSMVASQLQALEKAFEEKYPGVDLEVFQASSGKLTSTMNTEAMDNGQIACDLV